MNRTGTVYVDHVLAWSQDLWNHSSYWHGGSMLQALAATITIPALSPGFDQEWRANGQIDKMANVLAIWVRAQEAYFAGISVEIIELTDDEGKRRTPLLFIDIPSTLPAETNVRTTLLYGHMDKQPEGPGWSTGFGAWDAVHVDDKLYGRGSADDGYALFAALAAIRILRENNTPHPRCVIIIEAGEESGSPDLAHYMEHLAERIGAVGLVIALDSECGDYNHLWLSTSLRGIVMGDLTIKLYSEGFHSGAGGAAPNVGMIERTLLDRVEDCLTGHIKLEELKVEIPAERFEEAQAAASILGNAFFTQFPTLPGVEPKYWGTTEHLILAHTWLATLNEIGQDGLPPLNAAGNVLHASRTKRLAVRIPPTLDAKTAAEALKTAFEEHPPFGAHVTFTPLKKVNGWNTPALAPWLKESLNEASLAYFENPIAASGIGGCIPFMGMLSEFYPKAQIVATGVLGPGSNAHGPNEFLHIPTAEKLTACMAHIITHYTKHIQNERFLSSMELSSCHDLGHARHTPPGLEY